MDTNFSREILSGYDIEKLHAAVVLLVGAGAGGQNVAINLALSGVREVRIVDYDQFEEHNRTRSPFFPTLEEVERFGNHKAQVAANKLRSLMTAPDAFVRFSNQPIQQLGDGAFDGVNVVVACVDSVEARNYLADKCRWLGIHLVEAGFHAEMISLSCFPAVQADKAKQTVCYRCGNPSAEGAYSCSDYAKQVEAAGFIPAIQNSAAALAGLHAEAVIQALHGEFPLAGKRLFMNIRTGEVGIVNLTPDSDCSGVHRRQERTPLILQTTVAEPISLALEEIEKQEDAEVEVYLLHPWISLTHCTKCNGATIVQAPEWSWKLKSLCANCGGDFLPGDGPLLAPVVHQTISTQLSAELLKQSMAELGVPPMGSISLGTPYSSRTWRLPGSLDDLYQTVA